MTETQVYKAKNDFKRGSKTKDNVARATLEGLKQLRSLEDVARLRGKSVEEILG